MKVIPTFEYKNAKTGKVFRFFQNMNATEHVVDITCAQGVSDAVKRQGIQAITDITKSQTTEMAMAALFVGGLIVLGTAGKYVVCRIKKAINDKEDAAVIGSGSVE